MRRKPQEFTPLELEIMKVLWTRGPATVAGVQEALPRQSAISNRQSQIGNRKSAIGNYPIPTPGIRHA